MIRFSLSSDTLPHTPAVLVKVLPGYRQMAHHQPSHSLPPSVLVVLIFTAVLGLSPATSAPPTFGNPPRSDSSDNHLAVPLSSPSRLQSHREQSMGAMHITVSTSPSLLGHGPLIFYSTLPHAWADWNPPPSRFNERMDRLYRALTLKPEQEKLWQAFVDARRQLLGSAAKFPPPPSPPPPDDHNSAIRPAAPPLTNPMQGVGDKAGRALPHSTVASAQRNKMGPEPDDLRVFAQNIQQAVTAYEQLYLSATPEQKALLVRFHEKPKRRYDMLNSEHSRLPMLVLPPDAPKEWMMDDLIGTPPPLLPPPMIPVNR